MAAPSLPLLLPLFLLLVSFASDFVPRCFAAASTCPRSGVSFLNDIRSECPRWIELASPLEVDGEFLNREFTHGDLDAYHSIMFYASWCPFSANMRPLFDVLSSMFPQVKHLLLEESAVMPSALSRYGIHSFPAIILSNQTTTVRYHGSKNLDALLRFYKETTGFNPISNIHVDQHSRSSNRRPSPPHQAASSRELMAKEPFLVLAMLFICLRTFISILPVTYSRLKAAWLSHAWHLNLHIPYESRQLFAGVLNVIDFNRLWTRLKLCNKTRSSLRGQTMLGSGLLP